MSNPNPNSLSGPEDVSLQHTQPKSPIILPSQLQNLTQSQGTPLRYIDNSGADEKSRKKETAVLRGLKDLQQLQKQTLAVLEAVKANLDDIQQVLRSPEATRGLEKQQNAATLLAKGFAREAVEQAHGAVQLLPANPEAHLLLALSLAADQQFDGALAASRKGLALFDRRHHALAIEAGLLHALAALGCGAEAAERWHAIIDILPLPVLLEHMGRIGGCFPADAPEGQLDEMLFRRLAPENAPADPHRVATKPIDIPATALFSGLDAAGEKLLPKTRRAILGQIARRLQSTTHPNDTIRFLGDCLIPLGNRNLTRSANAMGRAAVKRLLRTHADAMTLHRAMSKLEMAGAILPAKEIATLLEHWRRAGSQVARARRLLLFATALFLAGLLLTAYVLFALGAIHGKKVILAWSSLDIDALWIGPIFLGLSCITGLFALMNRTWRVELPNGRSRLTAEELAFLRTSSVKHSLRAMLRS